jgi:tetratricopeptide (TPR) repeat protein
LGGTLHNLALLDLDAQRFSEARVRLREAIEHQKRALAANPRHPTYRQFLKNHYDGLLTVAVGLNDAKLADEARSGLAELAAGDPRFAALDERLAAVLGGEAAKDAAELLSLGQRAYDLRRFALAARWFGEALERDPALDDDRQAQHAYNAACSAVLAGSGQGLDDPPGDEAASAKLRGQAGVWLRAELDRWTTYLETATPEGRQVVSRTLKHWQTDADLAGIRDEADLARLPAEEQQGFTQLWADVAESLKKAEENPE